MRTEEEINEKLGITSESFIVEYLDSNGNKHVSVLLARNEEEAKFHCKYVDKDVCAITNVRKGTIPFNY